MLLLKIKGMLSVNQFLETFLWKLLQLIKENALKPHRLGTDWLWREALLAKGLAPWKAVS